LDYWLYVVVVRQGKGQEIYRIQNPAQQVDQYFFDDGWKAVAIPEDLRPTPLPMIPNLLTIDDGSPVVKLLDWQTGIPTESWVPIPPGAGLNGPYDEYFAIQLNGKALGIGKRGWVVIAIAAAKAREGDLVVVKLHDRVDLDTDSSICVRYWSPEESSDPNNAPLRLLSEGLVPPISLEDESLVQVLGIVRHQMFLG
jgi:hypothetical protein